MNVRSFPRRILAGSIAALLLGAQPSPAQTYTATSNGTFTNAQVWNFGAGPVPASDPALALTLQTFGTTATAVSNDLNLTLNTLNLATYDTGALTLNGTLSGNFAFTGTATINLLGSGAASTVSAPLVMGSGTTSLTFDGPGGSGANFTGVIASNTSSGAPLVIATDAGNPSTGIVTLSAANTFTGGVALNSGNLALNNSRALGDRTNAAGTLAFSGAGALNSASVTFGFGGGGIAGTYSLDFSGATAASGTPWRSLTALNTNSNFSLAHTVKLGASALAPVDLRVGSGTFGGTAGIITGFGKLVKVGPGTLTLNGATASTFTGGVEIWGGTLSISADSNLGNSANGISIMGGTLSLPFMGTGVTINRTITLGATTQPIISGNLSVSLNNTIASTNNDVINGTIQGPGGVDFSGVGNIVLGAASNTYQGDTQIRNAINLVFTSDAQLGAASSRIRLGNATLRLVANPGSLTTFITNRPIFLTDDSASTSGNLVVANSNATWQLNGPLWSASTLHELVFDGSGKLSIAGNNTSFLAPSRLVIPALRATCPWRPPASFAGAVWASRLLPSPRSTCRTSRGNLAICISAPAPPSPWARMAVSPRDSTTAGWGGTAKSPAVVQRR